MDEFDFGKKKKKKKATPAADAGGDAAGDAAAPAADEFDFGKKKKKKAAAAADDAAAATTSSSSSSAAAAATDAAGGADAAGADDAAAAGGAADAAGGGGGGEAKKSVKFASDDAAGGGAAGGGAAGAADPDEDADGDGDGDDGGDGDGDGGAERPPWAGSERPYEYGELVDRVFSLLRADRPELAGGPKRYTMKPPQVCREGTRKTVWLNFAEMCKAMSRPLDHVVAYVFAELGTNGSLDANQRLIIKGRFQPKMIEKVVRHYITEYVSCRTCKSPETTLKKENRLYFICCTACGSTRTVAAVRKGFEAQVGKRRLLRNKTAV